VKVFANKQTMTHPKLALSDFEWMPLPIFVARIFQENYKEDVPEAILATPS
jgi:hypothetical protein